LKAAKFVNTLKELSFSFDSWSKRGKRNCRLTKQLYLDRKIRKKIQAEIIGLGGIGRQFRSELKKRCPKKSSDNSAGTRTAVLNP
jgi:hypothetical protein